MLIIFFQFRAFTCTYNNTNWEFTTDNSKTQEENLKNFKIFLNDKLTEELKNCTDDEELDLIVNEDDDVLEEEEEDDEENEEGVVNGNPDKKFKASP
jgi:antitoxin component YwqK of YwqJK toxin-antitoxin module